MDECSLEKSAGVWKGFGKVVPALGLIISGGLTMKNAYEAIGNAKIIMNDLPLKKYSIAPDSILDLALGPLHFKFQIDKAIRENKDNPDNLYEIMDIIKTVAAFFLDLVFTVTNGITAVFDAICIIISIIGALGALATFGISAAVAAAVNTIAFIVAIVLLVFEVVLEWLMPKFWDRVGKSQIKKIAEGKIKELGGPIDFSDILGGFDFTPAAS
jgi:hypothetical protein